tara:strand:+ start:51 stop:521 length:471 start_codon:yes stop_codon:yes gene_type:complete
MVNASLNWASICGLALFLSWIPCLVISVQGINRLSSSNEDAAFRIVALLWQIIGPPICGIILFFQGWRLDPILQFGQALLVVGIIIQQVVILKSSQKKVIKEKSMFEDLEPLEPLEPEEQQEKSLESKLGEFISLKDKGLISAEECESLRKKTLGL